MKTETEAGLRFSFVGLIPLALFTNRASGVKWWAAFYQGI
jgi:hypothetical protein